jgi:hypothetical protein
MSTGWVVGWKREVQGGVIAGIAGIALALAMRETLSLLWGFPGLLFLSAGLLSQQVVITETYTEPEVV